MKAGYTMRRLIFVLVPLGWLCVGAWAANEEGLVAYCPFDEGLGAVARDRSGNGNDGKIIGGAKRAKGPWGSALKFDGKDDYIDCGASESLNISSAGTVMIWVRPETVKGGLVNWDSRLSLYIETYYSGRRTIYRMRDGQGGDALRDFDELLKNKWTHLTFTFDGKKVLLYRDGVLTGSYWGSLPSTQNVQPVVKGIPLWIGRPGKEEGSQGYYHGLLDEVRIYNRALSGKEIAACYRKEGPARGKDVSIFRKVALAASIYPEPGKIVATVDARGLQPLPEGSILRVGLGDPAAKPIRPIQQLETSKIYKDNASELIFDVSKLPAGKYVIRAGAIGPDGAPIGKQSAVNIAWPGRAENFKNVKVLNNLCWELLNVRNVSLSTNGAKQTFTLPYDRWVFVQTTADLGDDGEINVRLDSETPIMDPIVHSEAGESTLEAMRYLKAGEHTVNIARKGNAELKHLVVRAIPELQFAFFGTGTNISHFGPYDWDFLKKDVIPNTNVMVAGLEHYSKRGNARLEQWKKMGRKWISIKDVPRNLLSKKDAVEQFYQYWANTAGMKNPLADGIIVDEFYRGDSTDHDIYRQAVEKLYANPKFKGKGFYPYCDKFYSYKRSVRFIQTCIKGGGYPTLMMYFAERPTEEEHRLIMHRIMTKKMPRWEKAIPGVTRRMVMALALYTLPTYNTNHYPSVDFKVHMQTQMDLLSNHPAFFGLGGIQWYHSGYADEDTVRWAGRLHRYYAIEGNTDPPNKDPYILPHIQNPGFIRKTEGWNIQPAETGSIQAKKFKQYGRLKSMSADNIDDDFLWMKRSAAGPNEFSQEIRNLTPGRVYSMKMITSDYQDLVRGKSDKKQNAVSIRLDNVEIIPGAKNSFQHLFRSMPRKLGKFDAKNIYWLNYHYRVFRAKGTTAKLTVTDWVSDPSTGSGQVAPGGPVGQELMFSFIEIQPYFMD